MAQLEKKIAPSLYPDEITEYAAKNLGIKTLNPWYHQLIMGIMGGIFIALAAAGSNSAIHNISNFGVGKALAGALFSAGLMMVLIAGGELFTGNCLIVVSVLDKQAKISRFLLNLLLIFIGNLIGSLIIVLLVRYSGQLDFSHGILGGFTIKTAAYKTNINFLSAFFMGILCNILVCIAVWLSYSTRHLAGRILAVFFPIWLFVASGYEHCVANMYYIPAGILAKSNPEWVAQAIELGATQAQLDSLSWLGFLKNMVPVTLGNFVGGAVFLGLAYWFLFLKGKYYKKQEKAAEDQTTA